MRCKNRMAVLVTTILILPYVYLKVKIGTESAAMRNSRTDLPQHFYTRRQESGTEKNVASLDNEQLFNETNNMQKELKYKKYEASAKKERFKSGKFYSSGVLKNMSSVFSERHTHLMNQCKQLNMPFSTKNVQYFANLAPGPFKICLIAKVGSSSWSKLAPELPHLSTSSTPHPGTAIVVRHPLSRLVSAYRDKFLDGAPINSYNTNWQNTTQSIQSWRDRWHMYWLPALISNGLVPLSEKFFRFFAWNLHAYELLINRYTDLPGFTSKIFVDRTLSEQDLFFFGRLQVFQNAVPQGYTFTDPIKEFGNTSFTFVDFLNHVLWTNKLDVTDLHWMTFTEYCDPCTYKYNYILRLENISQESSYLLQKVLGYPEAAALPSEHRTSTVINSKSDDEYFKDVPKDLMDQIITLYKNDFDLFNYRINAVS